MPAPTHHIVLFDIDGTLADYEGAMRRDLRRLSAPGEPQYELHDHAAPAYFGARLDFIKGQPGWWRELPRLQHGFDILEVARELGAEIQILTTGPHNTPSAWMEKVQWCHANVGERSKVTVTEEKSLVFGKILVDDTPDYHRAWLERHPHGWGVMPVAPTNAGFTHPRVVRYDGSNLDEVRARMRAVLDT
ncbi:MAG: hypothetical protein U0575_16895 [Phycisphaerales bacterium]|jgi:hypothetical protein